MQECAGVRSRLYLGGRATLRASCPPTTLDMCPNPLLRFIARGRGLVQGYTGPEWGPIEGFALPPSDEADVCYSQDGSLLVAVDLQAEVVSVCDAVTGAPRFSIPRPKARTPSSLGPLPPSPAPA